MRRFFAGARPTGRTRCLGLAVLLVLVTGCSMFSRHPHEYAALQEQSLDFHDQTFPLWDSEEAASLRELFQAPDARLVWVVYFAPWCPNWRFQAPLVERLHTTYHEQGLRVVGINEYGTARELKRFFGRKKPSYRVMIESEDRADRTATTHFHYRQQVGDGRKWGSPWNLFFVPREGTPEGDVLAEQVWVVNGEVIESEVERFIQNQLGVKP